MVLHVRDAEADQLARRLALMKGLSITDAIKEALAAAIEEEQVRSSLWDRTAYIRNRLAAYPDTGLVADKKFYDSLSGDEDL